MTTPGLDVTGPLTIGNVHATSVTVGLTGGLLVDNSTVPPTVSGGQAGIIESGTAARMGLATLVGGTVTVATTAVAANSRIFLSAQTPGGTPGYLSCAVRVASTSFTILSSNVLDTSTVAWNIVKPL
jgi:hypothetical protein